LRAGWVYRNQRFVPGCLAWIGRRFNLVSYLAPELSDLTDEIVGPRFSHEIRGLSQSERLNTC